MLADGPVTPNRWHEATRDVAPLIADRTCIVIVGDRDDDAANAALALAEAHVRSRRVAIVDAVGELRPLLKLLPHDAGPHGVIDHFLHGVSLRKIAHAINRERTLFVVPSGAGPFEYETLLRRERWRRLTMAFRDEGALLCIILPANAAGLAAFVEDTDGVVLVGGVEYPEPRHVIARLQPAGRASADAGVPRAPAPRAAFLERATRQAPPKRVVMLSGALLALLVVGALFAWDDDDEPDDGSSGVAAPATVLAQAESAGMVASTMGDSAEAAAYAVDVVMVNSLSDAGRHLSHRFGGIPAATFSPVHLGPDSSRWYRLLVGAWKRQQDADSALLAMRDAGLLQMGFGAVRRTPFAVRVADDMSPTAALARAMELRAQGLPAYVLRRDEGHAGVYAGAFETPSQAMALLDMFKRVGIDATVAYRIGRGI